MDFQKIVDRLYPTPGGPGWHIDTPLEFVQMLGRFAGTSPEDDALLADPDRWPSRADYYEFAEEVYREFRVRHRGRVYSLTPPLTRDSDILLADEDFDREAYEAYYAENPDAER
jgi:hypothetical protein